MLDQFIILATALFLALLVVAVASDMRSHCIPNWVVGGVLALGLLTQCASDGWISLTSAASGALVGILFFLLFYIRNAMGAGDVKLMAASGAFLGPAGTVLACGIALASGLVLAVLALSLRRISLYAPASGLSWRLSDALIVERDGQKKVPYAAAIALGSLVCAGYLGKLTPITGLTN